MPTITVQAADSATAMDEIWAKLGPDAMIISTSKRNGRIVMEATTDGAKPAMAPSVEAGFSDIFKGQMLAKPAATAKAGNAPNDGQMPIPAAAGADIAALRRDIAQMQNMLSGLVLTDLDGVNPSLSASTRLELQRAGFSAASLNLLKARYAGLAYGDGCDAFLGGMAEKTSPSPCRSIIVKKVDFRCWCHRYWPHDNGGKINRDASRGASEKGNYCC